MKFIDPDEIEIKLVDSSKAGRTKKIEGTLDIGMRRPKTAREKKSIVRRKLRSGQVKIPEKRYPMGAIRVSGAGTPFFVEFEKKSGDKGGISNLRI